MNRVFCICCLLFLIQNGLGQQLDVEVFTWHPNGHSVSGFGDAALVNKRIDIYPNSEENMAGFILHIDREVNNALHVLMLGEDFFIPKGAVAVNTRNYDNTEFVLFDKPFEDATAVFHDCRQQTVTVYGIHEKWLYVEAKDVEGKSIRGWLPPDMHCGNPYTPCG